MTATTIAPPGQRCHTRGRRHPQWFTVARCAFGPTIWLCGWPPEGGPCYAVLAHCRPGLTVALYGREGATREALARIDAYGCGGRCCRDHELATLRGE